MRIFCLVYLNNDVTGIYWIVSADLHFSHVWQFQFFISLSSYGTILPAHLLPRTIAPCSPTAWLPSTLLLCLLLPLLPCSHFPLLSCSFAPLFRCSLAPLFTWSITPLLPHSMAALLLCSTTAALDCALSLVVKLYVRYYHIKLDYQSKGTSLSLRFTRCPGQCLAPLSFQQQTTTI